MISARPIETSSFEMLRARLRLPVGSQTHPGNEGNICGVVGAVKGNRPAYRLALSSVLERVLAGEFSPASNRVLPSRGIPRTAAVA